MSQQRPGVSDTTLIGAIAALLGVAAAFWLASGIGGFLSHGRWPDISFTGTGTGVRRLVTDPEDPMGAWPASAQAGLPTPAVFYSVLALLLLTLLALMVLLVRLRMYRSGRVSGAAADRRSQLAHALPEPTAVRRGGRPGGLYLGRDVEYRLDLYGSPADSYCVLGPPRSDTTATVLVGAVLDARGPVVVASPRDELLRHTAAEREARGEVHVFDPQAVTEWPKPLRWAPEHGCGDPVTALRRARALIAGTRRSVPPAPEPAASAGPGGHLGEQPAAGGLAGYAGLVQAVVRCYLHAAALDGCGIRVVRSWVADPSHAEPVRILREASLAADGWADELAELGRLDGNARVAVWDGVREAFAWLSDPRVVLACSPGKTERFDPSYFVGQRGTLYLIGSASTEPSLSPLVTALVDDVVEHGRRVAARLPDGRLDPPLLLILDDAPGVAPLPALGPLLAEGGGAGITPVAVLRSVAEARAHWGRTETAALWQACTVKLVLGGLAAAGDLVDGSVAAPGPFPAGDGGFGGPAPGLGAGPAALPPGQAVVLHPATGPVTVQLSHWSDRPAAPHRTHASRT